MGIIFYIIINWELIFINFYMYILKKIVKMFFFPFHIVWT